MVKLLVFLKSYMKPRYFSNTGGSFSSVLRLYEQWQVAILWAIVIENTLKKGGNVHAGF